LCRHTTPLQRTFRPLLFATDYPQAVRDDDEVTAYVKAVATLGPEARKIHDGANAEKLIPNLNDRLNRAI
jgi:hypothetical protein